MNLQSRKCLDVNPKLVLIENDCNSTSNRWILLNNGKQLCDIKSKCISLEYVRGSFRYVISLFNKMDCQKCWIEGRLTQHVSVVNKHQIGFLYGNRMGVVSCLATNDNPFVGIPTRDHCNDTRKDQTWSFISF